jgi:RNA polymerase sigma-70 factor (ECF subfamily)
MASNGDDPETWLDDYGDSLFHFAMARVRNRERAEDLVQDAFVAAIRNKDSFDGRSARLTWLTGILRHKIQDYYRTKWRETVATDLESEGNDKDWARTLFDERGHWQSNRPHSWNRPGAALDDAEFMKVFGACMEKLPGRLAVVFSLREVDEVDSEQICKDLEVTPTNFWAMMHRARTRLRQCLETNWFQT